MEKPRRVVRTLPLRTANVKLPFEDEISDEEAKTFCKQMDEGFWLHGAAALPRTA